MQTRRRFLQTIPATGAAFAVTGHTLVDGQSAHAQDAPLAAGHFHPKGKEPSKFTLDILRGAKATLPFSDARDFDEQQKKRVRKKRSFFASLPPT